MTMHDVFHHRHYCETSRLAIAVLVGTTLLAAPAIAQQASPAQPGPALSPDSGDIVVTANRREENVQKVPISVTAVSGTRMDALNIKRPEDLTKLVPGMAAIPNAGTAVSSYNLRGVSQADAAEHEEQPVAVYQDGVYIANSASTGFPIYDVQRVEVLRGPQGTLFGRNATGGLIQFISNAPTAKPGGELELTGGNYDLFRVQGYINGGSDKVAARLSVYHSQHQGYIKNFTGKDLASENITAIRGQVKFTPTETTSFTLRAEGWNSSGTADGGKAVPDYLTASGYPAVVPANVDIFGTGAGNDIYGYRDRDSDPWHRSVNDPGRIFKHARTLAGTFEHDMGDLSLFSITSYQTAKIHYREDTDGTPIVETAYADGADSHEFTQELRLQKSTGRFRFTGGVFFFDNSGTYYTQYSLPFFCSPAVTDDCSLNRSPPDVPLTEAASKGASNRTDYSMTTHSLAVFAQGEYDLTDKLTAIVGGRYTWDWQRFNYLSTCTETGPGACAAIFGVGTRPGIVSGLGLIHLKQENDDWSGKVGLNYKLTDRVLLYGSYSKGLKSAGFSTATDGFVLPDQLRFKPERLYSGEIGVKSTFFDRKLTVNIGAYDYNYKNFQTFIFSGVSFSVVNKPAKARGVELETTLRPGAGLTLNFGGAYNHFRVKDISTPEAPDGESQHSINSPTWVASWGVSKEMPVADSVKLTLAYNGHFTGNRYFGTVNEAIIHAPGYTIHDATATIETDHGLSVTAFVSNLTNKFYPTIGFDQTFNGFTMNHVGAPRTFGVSVGYKF
jgi:iron complex outermembrane receptor protein